MIYPTVHLNGTSKEALAEAYREAYSKAGELIEALSKAAPNARDYYPQGPNAHTLAAQEHDFRMTVIRTLRSQLEALYDAVDR